MNKYLYNVTKQTLIEKAKVLVCAEDVNTAEKAIEIAIKDGTIHWTESVPDKDNYDMRITTVFSDTNVPVHGIQVINSDGTSKFTDAELFEIATIMQYEDSIEIDQNQIMVLPENKNNIRIPADSILYILASGKQILIPANLIEGE